jgi:hypothetical protein
MRKDDVRSFVRRDWSAVASSKAIHWERVRESEGVGVVLRITDELLEQARSSHPGWPTEEDRRKDLEAHTQLSDRLRRAALRWRS